MARKPAVGLEDDAPELSDAELAELKPAREVLSADEFETVSAVRRGRPRSAAPKVSVTLRLDADILDRYKSEGPGWQTRINATLRRASATKRSSAGSTDPKPIPSRGPS